MKERDAMRAKGLRWKGSEGRVETRRVDRATLLAVRIYPPFTSRLPHVEEVPREQAGVLLLVPRPQPHKVGRRHPDVLAVGLQVVVLHERHMGDEPCQATRGSGAGFGAHG